MSANSTVTAGKSSAMIPVVLLEARRDRLGQDVEEQALGLGLLELEAGARASSRAPARARTKYCSSAYAVVATPRMLSAKNVTTTPLGMSGAPSARAESIAAENATRPANATNQGTA